MTGQTRKGFVTGGTWCLDYNLSLAEWPAVETAARILSNQRQGGGSACNFGVGLRRLAPEIPVETIALCGADADGDFLRGVAEDHGIDTAQYHVQPGLTTHRVMAFTGLDTGSRTHLFEAESSDYLTPDHFDFSDSRAFMLHLGLPGTHAMLDAPWQDDANGWVTILRKARAAGLRTNLELMTIDEVELRALVLPCLPHLDYLVVNDHEIGAITGIETHRDGGTSHETVLAAAHKALEIGAMGLVVVHFPQGAIAVERGGQTVHQASVEIPATGVVGSNGAGDAFTAGFFCGLHRGRPLEDCLKYAHSAAAASLRAIDTFSAIATIEECLALADEYGWRAPMKIA
ncbi:sugar/nucleoside kinase (ribokinase family) [Palleronia aestuarii]|uniref:Sugar/nucleoside kinase (Ribokinase family) n=1 Tax=Palleronia aestuarii TaxID=568105 RepID=A0A2W7NM45_9RHOB|nr:carbohydrate kinase family protein [Palleronia aestuarii]PZX12382.1 sugar/nucleoside kinase (ribokinase family) [Palleronia aestuarii]